MGFPALGPRLEAAESLAPVTHCFADIGADHGQLSAALLQEHPGAHAIIADISPLALEKARNTIRRLGLSDRSEFAVADGLEALKGRTADTVFILGMGGDTISGILNRGSELLHGAVLILGPHTELPLLRETLFRTGYTLTEELPVKENGRPYILMRAEQGKSAPMTEEELYLGPVLLRKRPENWLPWLYREKRFLAGAIHCMEVAEPGRDEERLRLFQRRLAFLDAVLSRMKPGNLMEGSI